MVIHCATMCPFDLKIICFEGLLGRAKKSSETFLYLSDIAQLDSKIFIKCFDMISVCKIFTVRTLTLIEMSKYLWFHLFLIKFSTQNMFNKIEKKITIMKIQY